MLKQLILLLFLFSCVGEDPILEFDGINLESFEGVVFSVSDKDSLSTQFTNELEVAVTVLRDTRISKWCVTESEISPSINQCDGGEGSDGGWSLQAPSRFTVSSGDGGKYIYLWLVDDKNNLIDKPLEGFIKLDTQAPTVGLNTASDISLINVNSYVIDGSCSDNTELDIKLGDSVYSAFCFANTWSLSRDVSNFSDGNIQIEITQTDVAGNISTPATATILKDTIAPSISLNSPVNGGYINISNVNSFSFSGTCTEDGTLNLSGAITDTISCSSGSFTKSIDLSSLGEGARSFSLDQTDSVGNTATQVSVNLTKDTVAPIVSLNTPSNISQANVSAYTLSGTCSSPDNVQVTIGGQNYVQACNSNAWTFNQNLSSLGDGSINISISQVDTAGNSSNNPTATVTKDTIAPSISLNSPVNGGYINISNVNSFSFSGTCTEDGTLNLSGAITDTISCSSGSFTKSIDLSSLGEGARSFSLDQTDSVGNTATQVSVNLTKDTVAPVVSLNTPSNISQANVSAYTLSGTCSSPDNVQVTIGGQNYVQACNSNAWTFNQNLSSLGDGSINISISQVDTAGNSSNNPTATVTKDTVAPTVSFSSPTPGSYINQNNEASFSLTGNCSEDTRDVVLGGAISSTVSCSAGNWSTNIDFSSIADGNISVTVNHTDAVGNNATQGSLSLIKDTVVPTVSFTSPAAGSYINQSNESSFSLSGNCSENTRDVVLGGAVSSTLSCTSGSWSTSLDFSAVADGNISVTVDHTDAAGNSANQGSLSLVKDTAAPTVSFTSPAAGSYINLSNETSFSLAGNCSENTRDVVLGGAIASTLSCTSGSWSTSIDFSAVADGNISVTVDHTDAAGNSATQGSLSLIKDTAAPTVSFTSPAAGSYINLSNETSFSLSGNCSENTRDVVLGGAVSSTLSCTSGSWSTSLDFSAVADGNISVTVDHTDVAGNSATQGSLSLVKDTAAPTVSFTSPADGSYINLSNETSFSLAGNCSEDTRNVVLGGAISSTVSCTSGGWSASIDFSAVADGSVSVTVDHTDAAGNSAPQGSLSLIKDTIAPTISWFTKSVYKTAITVQASLKITDKNAGASQTFSLAYIESGATQSSQNISIGIDGELLGEQYDPSVTLNTSASNDSKFQVNYTDLAGNNTVSEISFITDDTLPVITAGSFKINNSLTPPLTDNSLVLVDITASDSTSNIEAICLKYNDTTAPSESDACWIDLAGAGYTLSTNLAVNDITYRIGFTTGTYAVSAWAKDAAGHISSYTGTDDQDLQTIDMNPGSPPVVNELTASSADGSINLTIPSGNNVYLKWEATDAEGLDANPISIFYSTDEVNYTEVVSNLTNANQGGCTLSGTQTGCYVFSSPSSDAFRVRLGVKDSSGNTRFVTSVLLNTSLKFLAGNTDDGIGGTAKAGMIFTLPFTDNMEAPQMLVVRQNGHIIFLDWKRGVLDIDPDTGTMNQFIPTTGTHVDGAVSTAQLKNPSMLAMDHNDRLLIFDYDRIKRVDFDNLTITTILGGGSDTSDAVAPLDLSIAAMTKGGGNRTNTLFALPNGNIYFKSECYGCASSDTNRYRVYRASDDTVYSIKFENRIGINYGTRDDISWDDPTTNTNATSAYRYGRLVVNYDPGTSTIEHMALGLNMPQVGSSPLAFSQINVTPVKTPESHGYYSYQPVTTQDPALFAYSSYKYMRVSLNGNAYTGSKYTKGIFKVENGVLSQIAGTGASGFCSDGVAATSCNMHPFDVFVDKNSNVYILDAGRIRLIDQSGNMVTLAGQIPFYGDGVDALTARITETQDVEFYNGKFIIHDTTGGIYREFSRGGNITTLTSKSLRRDNYSNFEVDPVTGDIFGNCGDNVCVYDRSAGTWSNLVGHGGTFYFDATADGLFGNQIRTSYKQPAVMGYANGLLMAGFETWSSPVSGQHNASMFKMYDVTDSYKQYHLAGLIDKVAGFNCTEGKNLTTECMMAYPSGFIAAQYDSTLNAWLMSRSGGETQIGIYPIDLAGNNANSLKGTLVNLPRTFNSFYYHEGNNKVYYCSGGNMYEYDISNPGETLLFDLAISCVGDDMYYDSTANSLVFPYSINGLYGVAEYVLP